MSNCPCKECDRRTLTCHSVCHEYEDWKIEQAAIKDWTRDQNSLKVSDSIIKMSWKNKRLKNRKYVTNK